MPDAFRYASEPTPAIERYAEEERPKNNVGADEDLADLEPVESSGTDGVILKGLGIEDSPRSLPEDDLENLHELKSYIRETMKLKGIQPTVGAYNRLITDMLEKLDIDPDTDPSYILDRIGGLAKAWRAAAFITDNKQRMKFLNKLMRQNGSKKMDELVMEEMERRNIWR